MLTSQPLSDWSSRIVGVLSDVYGDRDFNESEPADRATLQCFHELQGTLEAFQAIPSDLVPKLTAAEAIRWLVAAVSKATTPAPVSDAIELLG